ncbi:MAG: IS66 family transposase [Bacteroidetes bacterium]|nr:IS66 family transposase [Bacteroidota bacterium]
MIIEKARGKGRKELLKNFKGYLQTDGYGVYDAFDGKEIKLLHCIAHARRYFDQAVENDKSSRANMYCMKFKNFMRLSVKAKENMLTHKERLAVEQELSVPILSEMHQWLKINITQVPPQSLIGKRWLILYQGREKLMLYCTDGRLEIDNNLVENAIRPVAIGRKNYLFAGSHDAAPSAAMIYSILGTCKMRGGNLFPG